MLFARQRHEIFQLPDHHDVSLAGRSGLYQCWRKPASTTIFAAVEFKGHCMAKPGKPFLAPRLAVIAASVVLVVVAALAWFTPTRSGAPLIGGPFALQTADGKTVTEAALIGHPTLVYFGYTHCPDICPTTLAQISDALAKLPGKPIQVLFITVDPERDSPKTVADYVSSFDPRMIGLSGSPEAIQQVEKAYRVYAKKAPGKDGDYAMDHSSVVYLMDRNGRFVEAFNLERSSADAAKELESYL
jgi:protein SCO1/2